MLLTILIISTIANGILLFNFLKQKRLVEELEIKLKITTDYANRVAEKSLKDESVKQFKAEKPASIEVNTLEQKPKKNTRRGRKKKPNNAQ